MEIFDMDKENPTGDSQDNLTGETEQESFLLLDSELSEFYNGAEENGYSKQYSSASEETKTGKETNTNQAPNKTMVYAKIAAEEAIATFCDQHGAANITILVGRGSENHPIQSTRIHHWLSALVASKTNKIPSEMAIKNALSFLANEVEITGERFALHHRFGHFNGSFYVNLCNLKRQYLRIDQNGCEIVNETPVPMFKFSKHLLPLPYPQGGEDIMNLLNFVNISDRSEILLFLVDSVMPFIAVATPPIRQIIGAKGVAKTTMALIRKRLCDPSSAELHKLPENTSQLFELLYHNDFIIFDNVGRITPKVSDLLCQAITGGAFMKRKLYTDSDLIIYMFRRRIIDITSVKNVVVLPDLLDRTRTIEIQGHISDEDRIPEARFWERFENEKPKLLGSILDTLSKAIAIFPTIKPGTLPRLADYACWGSAIAEALGYSADEFLRCFRENQARQSGEMLESHPIAIIFNYWLQEQSITQKDGMNCRYFKGSATQLYQEMREVRAKQGLFDADLPRSAQAFSRALNNLSTDFKRDGIIIKPGKSQGNRHVEIYQVISESKIHL
jgi:hypothetical protein